MRQWFSSRLNFGGRYVVPAVSLAILAGAAALFFSSGMWHLFETLDTLSDIRSPKLTPERVVVRETFPSGFLPGESRKIGFSGADTLLDEGCEPTQVEGDDALLPRDEVVAGKPPKERPLASESSCPKFALWHVARVPLAMGISVVRGDDLADWLSSNQAVSLLGKSDVFKGYVGDARSGMEIILRDLRAPRFLRWFLMQFLRSAFAGDASFSFENLHGRNSYLFSFDASRTFLARKGLLLAARVSVVRELSVRPLSHPVLELKVAKRRFFLAQAGERFYLGRNLSAMLNGMEWGRLNPARPIDGTVALSIHPEAFFGRQLQVLVGRRDLPIYLGVKLQGNSTLPTVGFVEEIPLFRQLRPSLLEDVLQPIPKDVVGAAAASFPPPRSLGREAFGRLLESHGTIGFVKEGGAVQGGIGVVWDYQERQHEAGVILTGLAGRGGNGLPIKIFDLEMDYVGSCLDGNAALFASSERLLKRMTQACAGAIPSYLGIKLFGGEMLTEFNVVAMLNPLQSARNSLLPPSGYVGRYHPGKGLELSGIMAGAEF